MKPADVARLRLVAQDLVDPPETTPAAVVARLGAVQSQDWFGGTWGIGLRGRSITLADVERAMESGAIIRTHVMRPTWHFVAPADLRWMLALTGPRILGGMPGRHRQLGLDADTLRRSRAILERLLAGGQVRTRGEIGEALRQGGIATDGPRLSHILMVAELEGLTCSGPRQGKQFTWAMLEERVPPARSAPATRDEMVAELARRYFTTHGPATAHDFAMWSGLTTSDGRRGAEMVGAALARVEVDGVANWMDAALRDNAPSRAPRRAWLLPNYDEYFIGFRDRSAILVALHAAGASLDNVALSGHLLVIDGQVVGGWRRAPEQREGTSRLTVAAQPLVDLPAASWKAIAAATQSLGTFLGAEATVGRPVHA